jgi:diguanylate cyclase
MEVIDEPLNENKDKIMVRYRDYEKRLRVLELDKIDLIQSVRLLLKSIRTILIRRGFNNDLVNVITKAETNLGFEKDCLKTLETVSESVSSLAERDSTFVPIVQDSGDLHSDVSLDINLKEVLERFLTQIAEFKNNRYQNIVSIINKMINQDLSLENIVPIIIDLCQRVMYDYSQEINNITNRINSLIRMLLLIEQEYTKFLDLSIINYSQSGRDFNEDLILNLGQLNNSVKENDFKIDANILLNQLSIRIEGLLVAVKKKSEDDAKLLYLLRQEKDVLLTRLDNVRRDYDNFVSQSHKTLIEMETIKSISLRDALTQVYNRRAYDEQIAITVDNFDRNKLSTFSLVIFDIDFFREVNNNYGHLAGDSILTNVGRIVKESLRSDDFIFRYGGDEFIILLPEAKLADAVKVAEKLRYQIEIIEFRLSRSSDASISVSISVGVTEAQKGDNAGTVFARADKALYVSKKEGRNKVSAL